MKTDSGKNRCRLAAMILLAMVGFFYLPFSHIGDCRADNQKPSRDLTSLSLEELMEVQVDTVVGASKYEQKIIQAPAAITIVTAQDVKTYGYRTLADILKGVQDFYVTYDRNYQYIGFRGFSRPGDYNTRFLLLVDGHRINDNIYGTSAIGTDFVLDVDLIERVEIIRGPGSSIYGTNAFLGVINVITRRGSQLNGGEVSGEAGSLETYKGRMTFGKGFADSKIDMLLSATSYRSKGSRDLYYPEFNSPDSNYGVNSQGDGDQYGSFFADLSLPHLRLQTAYSSRTKDIPTGAWRTLFNHPGTYARDERGYVDLSYNYASDQQLNINSRVFYDLYKYTGDYFLQSGINRDEAEGGWWGGEFNVSKRIMDRHHVIVGAEYTNNHRQNQKNYDDLSFGAYLDDRNSSMQWAFYAQDEIKILDSLIASIGFRYDYYQTFGSSFNPRIALVYMPRERSSVKLLYGRAFRAPTAYELYYNDGLISSKANPNLKPEKVDSYELLAEHNFENGIRIFSSVFLNRFKDLISQQTDSADGLAVFRNVDEVETRGVSFAVEKRWRSGARAQLAYTFQESENKTTGSSMENSPRHLAKGSLMLPLVRGKIFVGLEEQYTGERKTIRGGDVGAYFLTNITLFTTAWLKGLDLSASIYNVFDRRYDDPASIEHVQEYIEQDGIAFRVKATYRF